MKKDWPKLNGKSVYVTPDRFEKLRTVLDRRQYTLRVLIEQVRNIHNVNAIFRTCDAVGVLFLHYISDRPLPLDPSIHKGAGQWVIPVQHENTYNAVRFFKSQGFAIVVTRPSSDSIPYTEYDFTRPTVIVFGNEAVGVSDEIVKEADISISIPMMGMARSLNVSVSAGVILYESFRQRWGKGMYDKPELPGFVYQAVLRSWAFRQPLPENVI